jgi:putative FmdB family regulatory protein
MPLFEFLCQSCGERFEELLTGSSAAVECRACGSPEVRKQISAFAVSHGTSPRSRAAESPAAAPS